MTTSIQYIPSYNQRKNIFIGTILALFITFVMFIVLNGFVYSENITTTETLLERAQQTMQNYNLDMGANMTVRFDQMNGAMTAFQDNTLGGKVQDAAKVIAGYLVIIHFLLNIIQEAQKGEATAEMWLRIFLTLAISLVLIANSEYIFNAIESFGDSIYKGIAQELEGKATVEGDNADGSNGSGGLLDGSQRGCDTATLVWLLGKDNAYRLIGQSGVAYQHNQYNIAHKNDKPDPNKSAQDVITDLKKLDDFKGANIDAAIADELKDNTFSWEFLKAGAKYSGGLTYTGETYKVTTSDSSAESSTSQTASEAAKSADDETRDETTPPGSTSYDENAVDWTEAQSKVSIMTFLALLQIAMNCTVDGLIYTLAIQVYVRKLLSPIAISDISIEGTRSTGMRYIKHFFALYIQKVIIFMIGMFSMTAMSFALTGQIAQKYGDSNIPRLFLFMTISGCITGMMTQAGTLAKEIVGD